MRPRAHQQHHSPVPGKRGYRPEEAADYLGSRQILEEVVAAGWLKPVIRRHRLTIYPITGLARCFDRLEAGEDPREGLQ